MIIIHTALHLEAQEFIKEYNLKKDLTYTAYEYHRNANIGLVISGIGKVHAAAAVSGLLSYLLANKANLEQIHIINFGLSGCTKELTLGSAFLINTISDFSTGTDYFPELPTSNSLQKAGLITFDQPVEESEHKLENTLVDMEASGFFAAASKHLTPSQIHSVKIPVDQLKPEFFKKEVALLHIRNNFQTIKEYIESLEDGFIDQDTNEITQDLERELSQTMEDLKLDKEQQRKLIEIARQYENITKQSIVNFLKNFAYPLLNHSKANNLIFEKLKQKLEIEIKKHL